MSTTERAASGIATRIAVLVVVLSALLSLLVPTAATAAPAGGAGTAAPATTDTTTASPQVIVRWEPGLSASERAAALRGIGAWQGEDLGIADLMVVPVGAGWTLDTLVGALAALPGVRYAEPDVVVETTSNDQHFSLQWGLHNTGQDGGTNDVDVDAPEAWGTTRGSRDVIVAVIDTGVDINHPDLKANLWKNPGEIANNGIDDDGNGFVDDVDGWDFANNDNTLFDDADGDHHGTHVAGTIAAVTDNGIGVAGVAPNVRVMPLKFLKADGSGLSSDVIEAIDYAVAHGVDVINASWGSPNLSNALSDALANSGAVVLAASGNEGKDNDTTPTYPANLELPNLVSVGAIDRNGNLAAFSNRGVNTVDVMAPGVRIASTIPGGYGYMEGTSMATPHAAGVAALAASAAPSLTAAQIASVVQSSVTKLASVSQHARTGGMVNANAAVAAAIAKVAAENPSPAPNPGDACDEAPDAGFSDTDATPTHADAIDCAAYWDLTTGLADGTYGIGESVTRGQMATFVDRLLTASGVDLPAGPAAFSDVSGTHAAAINKLAEAGIVNGVTASSYNPTGHVTRAQMATFLYRAYEVATGAPLPAGSNRFSDDNGMTHETAINAVAAAGLANGKTATIFAPHDPVRRDQMASFLTRLLVLFESEGLALRYPS